jgi:hypothetical protein
MALQYSTDIDNVLGNSALGGKPGLAVPCPVPSSVFVSLSLSHGENNKNQF